MKRLKLFLFPWLFKNWTVVTETKDMFNKKKNDFIPDKKNESLIYYKRASLLNILLRIIFTILVFQNFKTTRPNESIFCPKSLICRKLLILSENTCFVKNH